MRSNGPAFVRTILALAFAMIVYAATPPDVLKQAAIAILVPASAPLPMGPIPGDYPQVPFKLRS
jgi:hypothetical protein